MTTARAVRIWATNRTDIGRLKRSSRNPMIERGRQIKGAKTRVLKVKRPEG